LQDIVGYFRPSGRNWCDDHARL